jgi:Fe-S-cluster containining protein
MPEVELLEAAVRPDCRTCGGACCEDWAIPIADLRPPGSDELRWIALHGTVEKTGHIRFEVRCGELAPEGHCQIYEDRPRVCRDYEVGGQRCLAAIWSRRTPEERERILLTRQ